MNKIVLSLEDKLILEDYSLLKKLIGEKNLRNKYEPFIIFDISHSFIRSDIAFLAYIYRELKKLPQTKLFQELKMRLKGFKKYYNSDKYEEYLEKCISAILLNSFISEILDIKEETFVNKKKLDLEVTTRKKTYYIEISGITLKYYLELLKDYGERYFSRLDFSTLTTSGVYFEVVFKAEPSEKLLNKLIKIIKSYPFHLDHPKTIKINDQCELFLDLKINRNKEKQIIRNEISSTKILKSTFFRPSQGLYYTLAFRFNFKSIKNKIIEEMKIHRLDKMKNILISIHAPIELLDELKMSDNLINFKNFLKENFWINGVILFNITQGSVAELTYEIIQN